MYFKFYLALSFFIGCVFSGIAYPITISDTSSFKNINDNILFYIEEDKPITFNEVLNFKFQKNTSPIINMGSVKESVWYQFEVVNTSNKGLYLYMYPKWLEEVDIYILQNNRLKKVIYTGSNRSNKLKSFKAANFYIYLPLLNNEPHKIYVRVKTSFTQNPAFELGYMSDLLSNHQVEDWIFYFYLGLLSLLFMYNGAIGWISKRKSYLFFAFYIVFLMISTVFYKGYDAVFFDIPWLSHHSNLWTFFVTIFFVLSIVAFLNLKKVSQFLYYYTWLIYIIVFSGFITNFTPWSLLSNNLFTIVSLLVAIWCLMICFPLFKKKSIINLLIAISFLLFMAGVLVFVLASLDILPFNALTREGVVLGTIAQVSLISVAFSIQLRNMMMERTRRLIAMNNELLGQKNSLEQFGYMIAHNLKHPIANIIGLVDLNKNGLIDCKESMPLIEKSVKKLDATIGDLNEILKLKDGNASLEWVEIDPLLNDIIEELFKDLEVNVSYFPDVTIEKLFTNKSYLKSILHNLIGNAIKYRDDKKESCIKLQMKLYSDDKIIIVIEDNGIGIDMDKYHGKIFGLYKRFTDKAEGTGLGLFMVKDQVTQLGGTVDVRSSLGEGTTFTVKLPLNDFS